MRLNPDCIRAILLTVEKKSDYHHQTHYLCGEAIDTILDNFSHEEIIYHINQCELSDLIYDVSYCDGGKSIYIKDLTPLGHEFLTNIKNETVWKKLLLKCANASLPILMEIAPKLALDFYLGQ